MMPHSTIMLIAVFETPDRAEKFIAQREASPDVSYYIDEATMYHELLPMKTGMMPEVIETRA